MKPEPKTIKIVCTACGLDWDAHGTKPTLANCVTLLRAELDKRPNVYPFTQVSGTPQTFYTQHGPPRRIEPKAATGDA